ncbi:hypothetical protein [Klebsiella michiganensis]|uniref:hypothetical protein n=1 Tax=Klebsiella michiganensis TaxID=1134687 RepID=UPI001E605114|nr:hypothetical protein [Klebsiella michiganensis]MCD6622880.1 hypothetical protein [Klebsiella michiganensis]
MSFFKELFSSMKFNARERTTNIYIGSFAFSWVTINWKFWITLLFGEGTVDSRIDRVSNIINWLDGLIIPILMSTAICFILPLVNKLIAKFQYEPNNYVKRMNDVSETRSLKRLAGIERLRAKAESARDRENAAQELATQRLKEEIQSSKDQSLKLTHENGELENKNKDLIAQLEEKESNFEESDSLKINRINDLIIEIHELNTKLEKSKEINSSLKNEIDKLKKNISSNTLGMGLTNPVKVGDTQSKSIVGSTVIGTASLNSPANIALDTAVNNITLKTIRDTVDNPALKTIRDAVDNPALKTIRDTVDNPALKTIRDASSGFIKTSQSLRDAHILTPVSSFKASELNSDDTSDDLENK